MWRWLSFCHWRLSLLLGFRSFHDSMRYLPNSYTWLLHMMAPYAFSIMRLFLCCPTVLIVLSDIQDIRLAWVLRTRWWEARRKVALQSGSGYQSQSRSRIDRLLLRCCSESYSWSNVQLLFVGHGYLSEAWRYLFVSVYLVAVGTSLLRR